MSAEQHSLGDQSSESVLLLSKISSMLLHTPSPIKCKPETKATPRELMMQRWERIVSERVPYVDQAEVFGLAGPARQFAPEYT